MGIPYSKQINLAFDQVSPLVTRAAAVLETTKNISLLLALIQVLTVLLLSLIFIALLALLVSVNPDLEAERRALVTPVLRWCAAWVLELESRRFLGLLAGVVVGGIAVGAGLGLWAFRDGDGEVRIVEVEDDEAVKERQE